MEDTNDETSIPAELSVHDYVEARAQEMLAMAVAAQTVVGNNLPLQKLPRHMRRRAASHHVRRLPRSMRPWAKREYEKAGTPCINKRPSRRHRRRPKHLLEEYNRRKQKNVWLETHIWHAKRFHMTERWGYKIALHPNDKGSRAIFRSSSKYCLLQDISFYCCIEISGLVEEILTGLAHLTSPEAGLTFGAKSYIKGTREGQLIVYHSDKYPYEALGPVKYLWRYKTQDEESGHRQIWVWIHPAMYRDFMNELRNVFQINPSSCVALYKSSSFSDTEKCAHTNTDTLQQTQTGRAVEQTGSALDVETFSNGTVTVTSLKDQICRFHLVGPLSTLTLIDSLRPSDVCGEDVNVGNMENTDVDQMSVVQDGQKEDAEKTSEGQNHCSRSWWKQYCTDGNFIDKHKQQKEFWENAATVNLPVEVTPHHVIGLIVRDPRKLLPPKKSMVQYENKGCSPVSGIYQICDSISWSPLWQSDVRQNVKHSKVPDSKINELRSKLLIPGSELPISSDESRIPLLLIQNPGHQVAHGEPDQGAPCCLGYGSGWDVIIPSGWAMPFLISLVYRGARVAGLNDQHSLMVEAGQFSYPNNFPDTMAGHDWELCNWRQLKEKHERRPPAKRVNYERLNVATPFHYPWKELLREWTALARENSSLPVNIGRSNDLERFYVIRCQSLLTKLQKAITLRKKYVKSRYIFTKTKVRKTCEEMSSVHEGDVSLVDLICLLTDWQCLVPVRLTMIQRGHPEPFAMICLPRSEDYAKFAKDKSYAGPIEPVQKGEHSKKHNKKTVDSATPPDVANVVQSCSRCVIGFVKEGSFSYSSGCGFGLGFVACTALWKLYEVKELAKLNECCILVRNTSSTQYRFAKLSIVTRFT